MHEAMGVSEHTTVCVVCVCVCVIKHAWSHGGI